MKTIKNYIKEYWLVILLSILPLLDIVTYFYMDSAISNIFTLSRFLLLAILFIYSFIISKNKKEFYVFTLIIGLYSFGHIFSCYNSGYINIYEDVSNLLRILYMPILLYSFIEIFKNTDNFENKVIKGISISFIITIISIVLSLITKSANFTYGTNYELGVIGWFYNKNTQSLIIGILAFICGIYSMKKKVFYIAMPIIFLTLYYNATKTAYLTLICMLLIVIFYTLFEIKNYRKLIYAIIFLTLALILFKYSPTYKNTHIYVSAQVDRNYNVINNENIEKPTETNKVDKKKNYDKLYRSYNLGDLIESFGLETVLQKYNYTTNSFILSNTRTKKKNAASLIYQEENTLSHLFGFEFTKINSLKANNKVSTLDLENDITAIFYYCGYIGITLYFGFIIYILFRILKILYYNPKYILKSEYMMWLAMICMLIVGAEYNGALLRRPNGNIYFSLIIAICYVKFLKLKKAKQSKITFLNLHLGFGGIESATINTVNELSKYYQTEIISFYNIQENQEYLISKKVNVQHLYNGEPNKKELKEALKSKNIFKCIKEISTSIKIIFLKNYLISSYIFNSDSKVIISTRYTFSKILSKVKDKDTIAIAQEHHHHNNNSKYIKVLKNKYKKIDYLFALTSSLADDYKKFLKKNKKTKIIVMPNMLVNNKKINKTFDNFNIISVGRLHKDKKIDELIEIVSIVNNYKTFYIIGDGDEYNNLSRQISNLKLNEKIKLIGYLKPEEISKYYQKSSVFIMASKSEGLPMVLLESMSYGVPCIAFETESGVSDIIDNNKNGYIIKNRNKQEFAYKIESLLDDKKKIKEFSNNSIIKSKQFTADSVVKKWKVLLDKYL